MSKIKGEIYWKHTEAHSPLLRVLYLHYISSKNNHLSQNIKQKQYGSDAPAQYCLISIKCHQGFAYQDISYGVFYGERSLCVF